jgi:hypothetical protein
MGVRKTKKKLLFRNLCESKEGITIVKHVFHAIYVLQHFLKEFVLSVLASLLPSLGYTFSSDGATIEVDCYGIVRGISIALEGRDGKKYI